MDVFTYALGSWLSHTYEKGSVPFCHIWNPLLLQSKKGDATLTRPNKTQNYCTGYLGNSLGFSSNSTRFSSNSTGFSSNSIGFSSNSTGFSSNSTGFSSNFTGF